MQTWWFKRKISQFIAFIQYIKIVPDLKLRSFVILVSFCLILSSFFLGLIIGRHIEAKRAISITNTIKHVSYNKKVLEIASIGASGLYAQNESDKNFVASDGGKVYYHKSCKSFGRIKEENRVWFKNKEDAELSGYSLAKNCKY